MRKQFFYLLLSSTLFLFSSINLHAATVTWTNGDGDGLWSTAANWSGGMTPTAADDVVFDGTSSTANCNIDVEVKIRTLDIKANYTGMVSLGSQTLILVGIDNSSDILSIAAAGSFSSGTGSVKLSGPGHVDCAASLYNLTIETAPLTDDVLLKQHLNINNKLSILQVNQLNGSNFAFRVANSIDIPDTNLEGTAEISAIGSPTTFSSAGVIPHLRVETGAKLQLLTTLLLYNFDATAGFTLNGDGNISGKPLLFGESGTVNFNGKVEEVAIKTVPGSDDITFSAEFNISADLSVSAVGNLIGSQTIKVGGNVSTTVLINGDCTLKMIGSGAATLEGSINLNVVIEKDGVNDQVTLLSSSAYGSIAVNNGLFDLNGESIFSPISVNSGGTLGGTSVITGDVTINSGGIGAPGNSTGGWSIFGNLYVANGGVLNMEITGRGDGVISGPPGTPGFDFDVIYIAFGAGLTAVIDGTINAIFGSYLPTVGDTYTLISVNGGTTGTTSTSVTSSNIITVSYTPASGELEILTAILPIDLLYFRATAQQDQVAINWGVASEEDNDYMAIERSADGLLFEEIGRVAGRGNSEEAMDYVFYDETPFQGINYYRLRQVDFDGATEIFPVVSVLFERNNPTLSLQLYPNPAPEQLNIRWNAVDQRTNLLRLFDPLTGRQIHQYQLDAGTGQYELPVSDLAAGTYLLQIVQGNKVESKLFVKK